MRRRFRLALLALLVVNAAHAADGCKLLIAADFPVTMEGLRPVVAAKINDVPVQMVVDSGAVFSVLTQSAVVALKLPTHPTRGMYLIGIGGGRLLRLATVKSFTLDSYPLHDVEFFEAEMNFGNGAVGLLGQNLMLPFDEEFDLARGVFRLVLPQDCKAAPGAYWSSSDPVGVVDIQKLTPAESKPNGIIMINGVQVRAEFDTGSPTSVLSLDAAKRAGITPASAGVTAGEGTSGLGGGFINTWIAPIGSIEIGGEMIKNTRIQIAGFRSDRFDMLVGEDFFLSHHVYVAKPQRKLFFTYNGGPVFKLNSSVKTANSSAPAPVQAAASSDELTDAGALMRRGAAYASRKDLSHALADLKRACELAPDEPENFYQLARVQRDNGQPDLALQSLDRALQLNPDHVNALFGRAELRIQQHVDAASDLASLDRLVSPADELRFTIADLDEQAGNYAAAVHQFDVWMAARPNDRFTSEALNGRCWARATGNLNLDQALSDCNSAVQMWLENPRFADSRGLVRLRRGELDRAIGDYSYALERAPKYADSLYGRGLARLRKGLTGPGKADLDAAMAIDPKIAERYAGWGLKP